MLVKYRIISFMDKENLSIMMVAYLTDILKIIIELKGHFKPKNLHLKDSFKMIYLISGRFYIKMEIVIMGHLNKA